MILKSEIQYLIGIDLLGPRKRGHAIVRAQSLKFQLSYLFEKSGYGSKR